MMRVWLDHLIGPKPQSGSKFSSLVNLVQARYIQIVGTISDPNRLVLELLL